MTVSDQLARPPDNPPPGPEWLPLPGAGYYEFSHRGKARSVDRTIDGKFYPGVEPLSTRPNNYKNPEKAYLLVDVRTDEDIRAGKGEKTTITMHSGVLRAHDREPEPWEETCHGPGGPQDNRWPENIRWGTRPENLADMAAARPPREPKPPKVCPRCGREHDGRGRRCLECLEALGQAAAPLIEEDPNLDRAARLLDYPSPQGLFGLAVRYGGLQVHASPCPRPVVVEDEMNVATRDLHHPESRRRVRRRLRRVIFRREASRQNSDAR